MALYAFQAFCMYMYKCICGDACIKSRNSSTCMNLILQLYNQEHIYDKCILDLPLSKEPLTRESSHGPPREKQFSKAVSKKSPMFIPQRSSSMENGTRDHICVVKSFIQNNSKLKIRNRNMKNILWTVSQWQLGYDIFLHLQICFKVEIRH